MAAATRARLLAHCRSLPHVTEDVKWGADLCFSIGGKMFAVFGNESTAATFSCKVPEDDFGALTGLDGIEPAAYVARYHWVSVKDPKALPASEATALLSGSYDLVRAKLPRSVQATLDGTRAAKNAKTMGKAVKKNAARKTR